MEKITVQEIEKEKQILQELVQEHGLTRDLVSSLTSMGYELKDISTSWKYYNKSGDILDIVVNSKKYLNGHYVGVGCGAKQMGKINMATSWCIYQGFVKEVIE